MSAALQQAAFESGLMDKGYHERLIADIQGVVQQAGIPELYVWTSMRKHCGGDEISYITDLKTHTDKENPVFGMVYLGKVKDTPINDRMMSIAGACLRNYINAKVMNLQEILVAMKNNMMPSPTVLLIPNFFLNRSDGGRIAEWEISSLIGLLYKRQQEDKQTVLYVGDWDGMKADYGQVFADHIGGNKFVKITTEMTEHKDK